MSKSLINRQTGSNKCGCASKALVNIAQSSQDQSVSSFISEQIFGVAGSTEEQTLSEFISTSNTTAGASNPVQVPTIDENDVIRIIQGIETLAIELAEANNVVIGGGGLTLSGNTISSNSNIILNPNNPSPCSGQVTINNNLEVNGCFTNLFTDDTTINGNGFTVTTQDITTTSTDQFHNVGTAGGSPGTFRVQDGDNNICNFIEMTSDPTRIHGATVGSGLYLFHEDRIELNTRFCSNGGSINILSDGDIVLSATQADSLISVNPGIEFTSVLANPSTSSPGTTLWHDSAFTNFKTFYTTDAADYPFVLSASENSANQFVLPMYNDNNGFVIANSGVSVTGAANDNIVTTGLVNSTGSLLDESATSAGILGAFPIANRGLFWVRNDAPTTPMFTDSTAG